MTSKAKTETALRLDTKLLEAMRHVKAEEGIPVTTQIEMAVRDWLTQRGTLAKPDRRRARRPRGSWSVPAK